MQVGGGELDAGQTLTLVLGRQLVEQREVVGEGQALPGEMGRQQGRGLGGQALEKILVGLVDEPVLLPDREAV